MRRFTTIPVALVLAVCLVASAIAAAHLARPVPGGERSRPTFTVKGKVVGLYPGVRTVLRAKVVNRLDHPVRVTRVTARVRSPQPTCPASSVRVRPWHGRIRVPAHGTRRVRLAVRMTPTTPDGCQGVRFRLVYGGRAILP